MIRNVLTGAIALGVLAGPLGCASNTPPSEVEAKKSSEALSKAIGELDESTAIVRDMMNTGSSIPMAQRKLARCVAVISNMTSGGLLLGGRYGDGVVSCRTGHGWSGPAFIKVGGGTAGLQAGVQQSDVVLLVMTDGARLFRKDFQLGADASVAAGPTGTATAASTADVLSYTRSRGLFAGVEVSGVGVKQNLALGNALYGTDADIKVVLDGEVPAPREATAFLDQLKRAFPE